MKKIFSLFLCMIILCMGFLTGCRGNKANTGTSNTNISSETNKNQKPDGKETINVEINGKTFEVALDGGTAAQELKGMLPLELTMQELNGNEKHGALPSALTQKVYSPGTIHAGDIFLWGSDTLAIFYKEFSSSYSYTKIGHIIDPSGLSDAVGSGSIKVSFQ